MKLFKNEKKKKNTHHPERLLLCSRLCRLNSVFYIYIKEILNDEKYSKHLTNKGSSM